YRGRLWTMRQYAGFATADESNARYRYLIEQGVNGLSVAFDLPTQMGYDSDHPLAAGEVGRVGVAIDSLADMSALFQGIPLDRVSTSMTINATAIILLALYVAAGRRQGVSPRAAAPVSHADGRQHAHRPAARQQYRPRRATGAGGGAGRHAVAALQRTRRSARPADRGVRADRAAHAADHRGGERRREHRRSGGGVIRD